MKLPVSQALYAYWHSICRGRSTPDRHDLDPAAMRGVLAHTFMLDVTRSDDGGLHYAVRLSGTRLDALFGRELKGAGFADLWAAEDRTEIEALLGDALDDGQPIVVDVRGAPVGQPAAAFELLLLPLRHNGRMHSRLLASIASAVTPPWIGLRPLSGMRLHGWRAIDRKAETAATAAAEQNGFAGGLRRAHLVVYEGGRDTTTAIGAASQVCVKADVSRSSDVSLSTRRS